MICPVCDVPSRPWSPPVCYGSCSMCSMFFFFFFLKKKKKKKKRGGGGGGGGGEVCRAETSEPVAEQWLVAAWSDLALELRAAPQVGSTWQPSTRGSMQHHAGERDEDEGGDQPDREPPRPAPHTVQHTCTLPPRDPPAYPSSEGPALPPARDAPAAAGRDAGCHEPTVTAARVVAAVTSRRHGRRPAGGGMQRQPVIHRVRQARRMRAGSANVRSGGRLHPVHALAWRAGLP